MTPTLPPASSAAPLLCRPCLSHALPACLPACLQTSLKEELENIEQTRTVWHMQLDHQRNRVLRVNLLIRWGGGARAALRGCGAGVGGNWGEEWLRSWVAGRLGRYTWSGIELLRSKL